MVRDSELAARHTQRDNNLLLIISIIAACNRAASAFAMWSSPRIFGR